MRRVFLLTLPMPTLPMLTLLALAPLTLGEATAAGGGTAHDWEHFSSEAGEPIWRALAGNEPIWDKKVRQPYTNCLSQIHWREGTPAHLRPTECISYRNGEVMFVYLRNAERLPWLSMSGPAQETPLALDLNEMKISVHLYEARRALGLSPAQNCDDIALNAPFCRLRVDRGQLHLWVTTYRGHHFVYDRGGLRRVSTLPSFPSTQ